MIARALALILAASLPGAGLKAEAPRPSWYNDQQSAWREAQEGQFQASAQHMNMALQAAEQDLGSANPSLIPLLLDAATASRRLAQWPEAIREARWALALARRQLSLDDELRRQACLDLANILRDSGAWQEAELLYGAEEAPHANAIWQLESARNLRQAGKRAESIKAYRKALALGSVPGPWLEGAQVELGNYLLNGEVDAARELFALAHEGLGKRLPAAQLAWAPALEGLGRAALLKGQADQAQAWFNSALELRQGTLGPDSWQALPYLEAAANLYGWMGRYGEASALFKRCVSIYQHALGSKHPGTLKAMEKLNQAQQRLKAKKG